MQLSQNNALISDFVHPESLTHKNPQRCKIIHEMHSVGCKEQSPDLKIFLAEYPDCVISVAAV